MSFEADLISAVDGWMGAVVLDFDNKEFHPAAMLEAVFLRLHKKLGERLRMCQIPASVRSYFEMNYLARIFNIHEHLAEATADLGDK